MRALRTEGSAMLEAALAAMVLTALLAGLIQLSATSSVALREAGTAWLDVWKSSP
jgi:hypothetical protein